MVSLLVLVGFNKWENFEQACKQSKIVAFRSYNIAMLIDLCGPIIWYVGHTFEGKIVSFALTFDREDYRVTILDRSAIVDEF